jgi:hypothetical protein
MPVCASLITYEFDGTCSDCTGTGVGLLTLQDYSLGTPLSAANFYSFTYTSDLFSMSIASGQLANIMGSLDTMPGTAFVVLKDTSDTPQYFLSNTDGTWCAGTNCTQDTGPESAWSAAVAAPEPSTLISVVATLLAIGLMWLPRARRI